MINSQQQLTDNQIGSFNRFLLDGAARTLSVLETVFELTIDCSSSSIEVAPVSQNQNLKHFGTGPLYIISSSLTGEINGSIVMLLRLADFNYLSEMMKPVLSLLFLSSSDTDLTVLEHQRPEWMQNDDVEPLDDLAYHDQMMDVLAEMGNILMGQYTRGIFKICGLNTSHSVPLVMKDPLQATIRQVLTSSGKEGGMQLVIENELFLKNKPLKLWCLIAPSKDSFKEILKGIDQREKLQTDMHRQSANWA